MQDRTPLRFAIYFIDLKTFIELYSPRKKSSLYRLLSFSSIDLNMKVFHIHKKGRKEGKDRGQISPAQNYFSQLEIFWKKGWTMDLDSFDIFLYKSALIKIEFIRSNYHSNVFF